MNQIIAFFALVFVIAGCAHEEVALNEPSLHYPIDNFESGISLKPFGKYVSPDNSPVQPERFRGYHNAVDIEIPEAQQYKDIEVYAFADCTIGLERYVSGYGGTVMLDCQIEGKSYTALYGHLDSTSFRFSAGDAVKKGDVLGVLGEGYSSETDGERMHLHFSLQEGKSTDLRGYVQNESELSGWIDPVKFFR